MRRRDIMTSLESAADTHLRLAAFYLTLHRIRKKVERDPAAYNDPALLTDVAAETVTDRRETARAPAAA
jgi:hypothetical protein